MGYAVIPVIASIVLALHHVALTDASPWSKVIVSATVAASLVVWLHHPRWLVVATLLQVAASVYMLVYLKLHNGEGR